MSQNEDSDSKCVYIYIYLEAGVWRYIYLGVVKVVLGTHQGVLLPTFTNRVKRDLPGKEDKQPVKAERYVVSRLKEELLENSVLEFIRGKFFQKGGSQKFKMLQ